MAKMMTKAQTVTHYAEKLAIPRKTAAAFLDEQARLAAKEAKALNHTYVGTEHILLGLLRDGFEKQIDAEVFDAAADLFHASDAAGTRQAGPRAYSHGCRTPILIPVGRRSNFCRTPFRFISDSVPG